MHNKRGARRTHRGYSPDRKLLVNLGSDSQTKQKRISQQDNFDNLINWLLFSNLDFDFIAESMIPELYKGSEDKKSRLGEMNMKR